MLQDKIDAYKTAYDAMLIALQADAIHSGLRGWVEQQDLQAFAAIGLQFTVDERWEIKHEVARLKREAIRLAKAAQIK